mmetsp:Transcript_70237/g.187153  ORF Transcript_70237/g.187153 Transcript_70237/m.187153 type:complete len:214 (+) Transcript_70237:526-1167(+)
MALTRVLRKQASSLPRSLARTCCFSLVPLGHIYGDPAAELQQCGRDELRTIQPILVQSLRSTVAHRPNPPRPPVAGGTLEEAPWEEGNCQKFRGRSLESFREHQTPSQNNKPAFRPFLLQEAVQQILQSRRGHRLLDASPQQRFQAPHAPVLSLVLEFLIQCGQHHHVAAESSERTPPWTPCADQQGITLCCAVSKHECPWPVPHVRALEKCL